LLSEEFDRLMEKHAELIDTVAEISKHFCIDQERKVVAHAEQLLALAANFDPRSGVSRDDARSAVRSFVAQLPRKEKRKYAEYVEEVRCSNWGQSHPGRHLKPRYLDMRSAPGMCDLAGTLAIFCAALKASFDHIRYAAPTYLAKEELDSLKELLSRNMYFWDTAPTSHLFDFTAGEGQSSAAMQAQVVAIPDVAGFIEAHDETIAP
jgi:hypothetical protein